MGRCRAPRSSPCRVRRPSRRTGCRKFRTRPASAAGGQHAADQLVGDLGGRQVEHRRRADPTRRASPSTARRCRWRGRRCSRGRPSSSAVARLHAGRGDAEHRQSDRGQRVAPAPACQARTMPAIACAALASTWREMRFSPDTSTTGYSIMDVGAADEGAHVARRERAHEQLGAAHRQRLQRRREQRGGPEPPAPITPPTAAARATRKATSACAIAPTALPRSPLKTACTPPGCAAATSAFETSQPRGARVPRSSTSTVTTATPWSRMRAAMKLELLALGVEACRRRRPQEGRLACPSEASRASTAETVEPVLEPLLLARHRPLVDIALERVGRGVFQRAALAPASARRPARASRRSGRRGSARGHRRRSSARRRAARCAHRSIAPTWPWNMSTAIDRRAGAPWRRSSGRRW